MSYNTKIIPRIRDLTPDISAHNFFGLPPIMAPTGTPFSIKASMFPGYLSTFDDVAYVPYNMEIMFWFLVKEGKGKEKCQQLKKKCQRLIAETFNGTTI